ncbi:MAG: hypothetical protein L0Y72_22790 [Gemmataceae bacterium]|nr:hypothetical protein [Gemmataceae bacterium]MCI0741871.1 hypothetical protein [Gemmataceae bacterium]
MFARMSAVLILGAALCSGGAAQEKKKTGKDILLSGTLTGLEQVSRHAVELRKDENYAVEVEARGFFANVEVQDGNGNTILHSSRFSAFQPKQDGAYRLLVSSPGGSSGQYTITIRQLSLSKEPTGVITVGKDGFVLDTLLNSSDPPDKVRKTPCRVYQLQMHAGKTYVIDMISKNFDAYLRLEDAAGNKLTQDDDSGGGNNARMKWVCKADGVYRVIATTFGRGTGLFTLKLREEETAAPPIDKDKDKK